MNLKISILISFLVCVYASCNTKEKATVYPYKVPCDIGYMHLCHKVQFANGKEVLVANLKGLQYQWGVTYTVVLNKIEDGKYMDKSDFQYDVVEIVDSKIETENIDVIIKNRDSQFYSYNDEKYFLSDGTEFIITDALKNTLKNYTAGENSIVGSFEIDRDSRILELKLLKQL